MCIGKLIAKGLISYEYKTGKNKKFRFHKNNGLRKIVIGYFKSLQKEIIQSQLKENIIITIFIITINNSGNLYHNINIKDYDSTE